VGKSGKKRGDAPARGSGTIAKVVPDANSNKLHPVFCLRHLQQDYNVSRLDKDKRAAFALALERRAQLSWDDIGKIHRHKLGFENLPRKAITAPIPPAYDDADTFMVFRYCDKLPMVGVRAREVFHVLWIAENFSEVYDHG
jgi:hypothetical protein